MPDVEGARQGPREDDRLSRAELARLLEEASLYPAPVERDCSQAIYDSSLPYGDLDSDWDESESLEEKQELEEGGCATLPRPENVATNSLDNIVAGSLLETQLAADCAHGITSYLRGPSGGVTMVGPNSRDVSAAIERACFKSCCGPADLEVTLDPPRLSEDLGFMFRGTPLGALLRTIGFGAVAGLFTPDWAGDLFRYNEEASYFSKRKAVLAAFSGVAMAGAGFGITCFGVEPARAAVLLLMTNTISLVSHCLRRIVVPRCP